MQIAIRIAAACVAATLFSPVLLFAEDTSAQTKARQALEQHMKGNQPASTPSTTAPAAQEAPPATATPAATTPPPAKPATITPAQTFSPAAQTVAPSDKPVLVGPEPSSDESIEKARQALRQKMAEKPGTAPAAATHAAPAAAAPVVSTSTPEPAVTAVAPAAAATSGYESEKQKAAHEAKAAAEKQAAEEKAAAKEKSHAEKSAMHASKKGSSTLEPLKGPPSPLTPEKQSRLKDLLDQYMADQLTPEQYHAERAKILAGQ